MKLSFIIMFLLISHFCGESIGDGGASLPELVAANGGEPIPVLSPSTEEGNRTTINRGEGEWQSGISPFI